MASIEGAFYLRNRSGMVAASHGAGDLLVVPSGNVVDMNEFWSETTEDLADQLTEHQRHVLVRMLERAAAPKSDVEEIVERFARNRKIQEHLDGTEPERVYRELPESVRVIVADFD